MSKLSPIVLFVYNRPGHTRQTLEALQANNLAPESDLFIYSDAPKNEADAENVDAVRSYLRTIQGFKSVTIIEREKNWGLAANIINGVTEIVNRYGKIIVLEDDIVTSPYFLEYMNGGLEKYGNSERVMCIHAYTFPVKKLDTLPETFFLPLGGCWGWATWQDRWRYFEKKPQDLIDTFSMMDIFKFNLGGVCKDHWQQVLDNQSGKLNTWAIFWAAAVFIRGGLTLHSSLHMAKNIGFDNTGEHCGIGDSVNVELDNKPVTKFTGEIRVNETAVHLYKQYFKKERGIMTRILNKLKRCLGLWHI